VSRESLIDELYGSDPESFIDARREFAANLAAAGDKEGAKQVKSLRKPTLAAWAVNRLVRDERGQIDLLLETGRRLRDAQRRVLSGGSPRGLNEATADRRRLVKELTASVEQILSASGRSSPSVLEQVTQTLDAAAVSQESAELVAQGRLTHAIEPPPGLGNLSVDLVVVPPESESKVESEPEPDSERRRELQRAAAAAERSLEAARLREAKAREKVERAESSLSEAKAALRAAEAERRRASVEARRARRGVQTLERKGSL
jgi:hypothetical protein